MATIADLLAAAIGGNNPMPLPYGNALPRRKPPPPQPPPAWLPPDFSPQQEPTRPQGQWGQEGPRIQTRPGALFYRLNPAPRDNWRDIVT